MELYTISATPVSTSRGTVENDMLVSAYPDKVAAILDEFGYDGFTIYPVQGFWQGVAEPSFKIELATASPVEDIQDICKRLRDEYNQDAVMLTRPSGDVEFI